tara:strand:+ start:1124 stop:2023 length:900 start_codon:yes stop_codon:yes gene_type:complete
MNLLKPLVIVLIGPTASGKTELAIDLAKYFKLNIHNIDSRQIYLGMDIGTAKPTKEQQKVIKHYLIDLQAPNQQLNVKIFQEIAQKSINKELKKGITPFLVGGSGLYMNSITQGFVTPEVAPQEFLREQFIQLGQEQCWHLLKLCDPSVIQKIKYEDQNRTIRALEVFYSSGQPISSQQSKKPPPWQVLELGLDREDLRERILQRSKNMFNGGIIEETKELISEYGNELSLLQTIGYKEAYHVIQKKYNLEKAIEITTRKTINFAKRQRTWFRNKNNPYWLNNKNPLKDAIIKIESAIC